MPELWTWCFWVWEEYVTQLVILIKCICLVQVPNCTYNAVAIFIWSFPIKNSLWYFTNHSSNFLINALYSTCCTVLPKVWHIFTKQVVPTGFSMKIIPRKNTTKILKSTFWQKTIILFTINYYILQLFNNLEIIFHKLVN